MKKYILLGAFCSILSAGYGMLEEIPAEEADRLFEELQATQNEQQEQNSMTEFFTLMMQKSLTLTEQKRSKELAQEILNADANEISNEDFRKISDAYAAKSPLGMRMGLNYRMGSWFTSIAEALFIKGRFNECKVVSLLLRRPEINSNILRDVGIVNLMMRYVYNHKARRESKNADTKMWLTIGVMRLLPSFEKNFFASDEHNQLCSEWQKAKDEDIQDLFFVGAIECASFIENRTAQTYYRTLQKEYAAQAISEQFRGEQSSENGVKYQLHDLCGRVAQALRSTDSTSDEEIEQVVEL